jgi:hypothetical protein
MAMLRISGPVRRAMGRNAELLDAGTGLPVEGQCWQCGEAIAFLSMRPGSVSLSVVQMGTISISAWGHAEHAPSQVFTPEQFEAAVRAAGTHPDQMPSPIAPSSLDEGLLVEGEQIG